MAMHKDTTFFTNDHFLVTRMKFSRNILKIQHSTNVHNFDTIETRHCRLTIEPNNNTRRGTSLGHVNRNVDTESDTLNRRLQTNNWNYFYTTLNKKHWPPIITTMMSTRKFSSIVNLHATRNSTTTKTMT